MPHISELHEMFKKLDITSNNIALWEALLQLDISTFKPIMNEIISGRLDIEDTRKILPNKLVTSMNKRLDRRISDNKSYFDILANNLMSRINGDGTDIIKENIVVYNVDHYKIQIAEQYEKETGNKLTSEEIESILLIADIIAYQELNTTNIQGAEAKKLQNVYSNLLSFKPDAKV